VNPVRVLSRFKGAWSRQGRSLIASWRQNWYSVASLPVGASRTPRVHLPVLTSTRVMGVV
jgi:hypothetical protein